MSNSSESLPIPKTIQDINRDWIIQATKLHPVEGTISITGNVQDGVGFLSNLIRVAFQTETGNKVSILVKLLPATDTEFYDFAVEEGCHKIEIGFYSLVSPQLVEIAPELGNSFCKHYSSKFVQGKDVKDIDVLLVMEDLGASGYKMYSLESTNWEDNLEKTMKFQARLHAAGIALEKKLGVKLPERYTLYKAGKNADAKGGALLTIGLENSVKLNDLLVRFDCPDDVRKAYSDIAKHVEWTTEKMFEKGNENPCLIHGDLWPPNIMVNEDLPNSPVKIIDWQLLGYKDPTFDLAITILTSIPNIHYSRDTIRKFAKIYFREFKEICKYMGIEYNVRDEKGFMDFFDTWGVAFGMYWWIWSLVAFPDHRERLSKVFEVLAREYKIPEFLGREFKSSVADK